MAVNTTKLLSGRAQLVPYANLTADRYQFLSLSQAEPSLGGSGTGNVLTLGASNARVWSNELSVATVSATGNITCNYILGNGACLTGVITSVANINNGTSNVSIDTANGNITMAVDGTSNVVVITQNNVNLNNLVISNTTVSTSLANGNITLTSAGTGLVQISGNAGVVIPAGNTAQRPSPAITGTLRVNTALNQIEAWDGTSWITGGGSSGNVAIVDQQITPDGTSITYTLDQPTTESSILVSFNGVAQLPGVAYTVSGNTIIFTNAPLESDIVDIRFLAYATNQNQILNSSGNTKIQTNDSSNIVFTVASTEVAAITTSGIFDISSGQSLKLPSYTVAQAANIASPSTGQVIYCSNGDTGNPCLAVYSGGAWKRVSFGANIST